MEAIIISDRTVTFQEFVLELSDIIARKIAKQMKEPAKVRVSQNEAFRTYGKGNVQRWIRTNRLKPVAKHPGKIEYLVADLVKLSNVEQDYLYV